MITIVAAFALVPQNRWLGSLRTRFLLELSLISILSAWGLTRARSSSGSGIEFAAASLLASVGIVAAASMLPEAVRRFRLVGLAGMVLSMVGIAGFIAAGDTPLPRESSGTLAVVANNPSVIESTLVVQYEPSSWNCAGPATIEISVKTQTGK